MLLAELPVVYSKRCRDEQVRKCAAEMEVIPVRAHLTGEERDVLGRIERKLGPVPSGIRGRA